jgi:hypothetical protein
MLVKKLLVSANEIVDSFGQKFTPKRTPSDGTDLSYYASFRSTAGISKFSEELN